MNILMNILRAYTYNTLDLADKFKCCIGRRCIYTYIRISSEYYIFSLSKFNNVTDKHLVRTWVIFTWCKFSQISQMAPQVVKTYAELFPKFTCGF